MDVTSTPGLVSKSFSAREIMVMELSDNCIMIVLDIVLVQSRRG
jgi:hypothetical protein